MEKLTAHLQEPTAKGEAAEIAAALVGVSARSIYKAKVIETRE